MNNSESSETEENKIKTREAPWIHPEAVAALIRSGEAEDRDRPALIRLYIRAQMAFFGKPGQSGKAKDYWPDNQTIADCLGVDEYDVQNALRYSDIERIDGGKGRGQNKRFMIVKKGRNHGGKKGKRKTSNLRDQSDSENVESTSATRNIDVCQQSNQRLQHVESTSATGWEGDGLEIKGEEGEGGGSLRACAREPKAPPPVVSQDSCKIQSKEESLEFLKEFNLLDPQGLSKGYYGLLAKVSGARLHDGKDKDAFFAGKCLEDLPADFKRAEILTDWIYWYTSRLGSRWNMETHYFTRFSDTWKAFRPQAITILKDLKSIDEERRKEELLQKEEQEEAERIRQEAQDALQAAEDERLGQEEQFKQQTRHNDFVASLPAKDSIIASIMAVPDPATLRRKDYVEWLDALLGAAGLNIVIMPDHNDWGYIRNAFKAVGFDPRRFIERTREYAVANAGHFHGRLKADVSIHQARRCVLKWESYPEFFGVDMIRPESCAFEIPKHLLDYQTLAPPAEAEKSMPTPMANREDFESPFED